MQTVNQHIKDAFFQMRLHRFGDSEFRDLVTARNGDNSYFEKTWNLQTRFLLKKSETITPDHKHKFDLLKACNDRCSSREFGDAPVECATVRNFLFFSFCRKGEATAGVPPFKYRRRPYPAAGTIYAIEPYLFVKNVRGMEPGLYHFRSATSELTQLNAKPDLEAWARAFSFSESMVDSYSFVCFHTINFNRACWKYGARGFQFAFLEAGMALQTSVLVATSLDLKSTVWGGYYESEIEDLIGILPPEEQVISLTCFGTGENNGGP